MIHTKGKFLGEPINVIKDNVEQNTVIQESAVPAKNQAFNKESLLGAGKDGTPPLVSALFRNKKLSLHLPSPKSSLSAPPDAQG